MAVALAEGRRAFYTAPIKALSNQKFRDLRAIHGADRVGLLTGDNSINADAPVVVMTTEVLRNMIYGRSPALHGLGVVVLDEVHFLQDTYRGPVWEEVIIHLPPAVRLVCLSATVSNAEELAAWMTTVRGPTAAVIEERRPGLAGEPLPDRRPHGRATAPAADPGRRPAQPRGPPARQRGGARRPRPAPHPGPPQALHARPAGGAGPARGSVDAAGHHFIFSRNGCDEAARSVTAAGRAADDRRGARPDPGDRRRARRRPRRTGPGRPRLRPVPGRAGGGRRRAPRRDDPAVQGGGRGLLHRGAGEDGLRHRDAGRRHQHAGADRRHREAEQVHRRPPRVPDARRLHAADRSGRPAGHRRAGLRHRPVEPVRPLRPGVRAGLQPLVPAQLGLPPDVQHDGQPGALATPGTRPTTCSTCPSRSTRPTATWCAWRPGSSGARRSWPSCGSWPRSPFGDLDEYRRLREGAVAAAPQRRRHRARA